MKILVAEDKVVLGTDLIDRIETFGGFHVSGPFMTGDQALNQARSERPDIALLDITLNGEMDGVTLAKELRDLGTEAIIFLTRHDDEATLNRVLGIDSVAFLNKPCTNVELKHALKKAMKVVEANVTKPKASEELNHIEALDDRVFIKNGLTKYYLKLEDILWIQSGGGEKSTIEVRTDGGRPDKKHHMVTATLGNIEQKLSFAAHLHRCNRYTIININAVDRIVDEVDADHQTTGQKKVIIQEQEFKVGEKYKRNILDRFRML